MTRAGETLANLDISDLEHPILARPSNAGIQESKIKPSLGPSVIGEIAHNASMSGASQDETHLSSDTQVTDVSGQESIHEPVDGEATQQNSAIEQVSNPESIHEPADGEATQQNPATEQASGQGNIHEPADGDPNSANPQAGQASEHVPAPDNELEPRQSHQADHQALEEAGRNGQPDTATR